MNVAQPQKSPNLFIYPGGASRMIYLETRIPQNHEWEPRQSS
jgi:hypothetical protein